MRRFNLKVPNTIVNKMEMIKQYREYTSYQSLLVELINYGATYMLKRIDIEQKKAAAGSKQPLSTTDKNSSLRPAEFQPDLMDENAEELQRKIDIVQGNRDWATPNQS